MYQFEANVYQVREEVRAYGHFKEHRGKTEINIAERTYTLRLAHGLLIASHGEILQAVQGLCLRIAQDIDEPLF